MSPRNIVDFISELTQPLKSPESWKKENIPFSVEETLRELDDPKKYRKRATGTEYDYRLTYESTPKYGKTSGIKEKVVIRAGFNGEIEKITVRGEWTKGSDKGDRFYRQINRYNEYRAVYVDKDRLKGNDDVTFIVERGGFAHSRNKKAHTRLTRLQHVEPDENQIISSTLGGRPPHRYVQLVSEYDASGELIGKKIIASVGNTPGTMPGTFTDVADRWGSYSYGKGTTREQLQGFVDPSMRVVRGIGPLTDPKAELTLDAKGNGFFSIGGKGEYDIVHLGEFDIRGAFIRTFNLGRRGESQTNWFGTATVENPERLDLRKHTRFTDPPQGYLGFATV